MNWKLKLESKGIQVIDHLSEAGNKIGWFNFTHPKGYLCLAQNGTYSVVDNLTDWSSNTYCCTDFDYFFDNIEIFRKGSIENFNYYMESHIKEYENKKPYEYATSRAWRDKIFSTKDKFEQKKILISLLEDLYNKNANTSYKWN